MRGLFKRAVVLLFLQQAMASDSRLLQTSVVDKRVSDYQVQRAVEDSLVKSFEEVDEELGKVEEADVAFTHHGIPLPPWGSWGSWGWEWRTAQFGQLPPLQGACTWCHHTLRVTLDTAPAGDACFTQELGKPGYKLALGEKIKELYANAHPARDFDVLWPTYDYRDNTSLHVVEVRVMGLTKLDGMAAMQTNSALEPTVKAIICKAVFHTTTINHLGTRLANSSRIAGEYKRIYNIDGKEVEVGTVSAVAWKNLQEQEQEPLKDCSEWKLEFNIELFHAKIDYEAKQFPNCCYDDYCEDGYGDYPKCCQEYGTFCDGATPSGYR